MANVQFVIRGDEESFKTWLNEQAKRAEIIRHATTSEGAVLEMSYPESGHPLNGEPSRWFGIQGEYSRPGERSIKQRLVTFEFMELPPERVSVNMDWSQAEPALEGYLNWLKSVIGNTFEEARPGLWQAGSNIKLSFQQIDNIVQNNLLIMSGCEFERKVQGGNILYSVTITTGAAKLSLGTYRVWQWADGGGRSGWMEIKDGNPEIERLRKLIWDMIATDTTREQKLMEGRVPLAGLSDDTIRQVAINTTGIIAGSDYDGLSVSELKHKAARFDSLRSGGMETPATQPIKDVNTIADSQAGTVTYKRNEDGQTIISGGTVNPGHKFELGQGGVAFKWEGGGGQPQVFEVTGAGQAGGGRAEKLPRKQMLDQAAIEWAGRNDHGYIGAYTRTEFLQWFEEKTGIYIPLDDFKRALRDAERRGLIQKANGRFRPITRP